MGGDHLVVTDAGLVRFASDVAVGRNGRQRGRVVAIDELDEPGRADLRREHGAPRHRPERLIRPIRSRDLPLEIEE